MVYTCFSCKWRSDKLPRRSFHKFPSNEELKQKWLEILGKTNVSIGKRTSLCCLHFEEDCFRYGLVNGTRILKDGSLPTLHLTNSAMEKQDLVHEIKNKTQIESSTRTEHSTSLDVPMTDSTPDLIIGNHQLKPFISELVPRHQIEIVVPIEFCSISKSSSLDGLFAKGEILPLKNKIQILKDSVISLRNSESQRMLGLSEWKKRVQKCVAENKLMQTCRVCISLDSKMYNMSEVYSEPCQSKGFKLDQMYEYVTGVAVNHNDKGIPCQICQECAASLHSCYSFKSKALLSEKLLQEVLEQNEHFKEKHTYTQLSTQYHSENPLGFAKVKIEKNIEIENDEIRNYETPIIKVKTTDILSNFMNVDTKEFQPNGFVELSSSEAVLNNDFKAEIPVDRTVANMTLLIESEIKVEKKKIKKEVPKKQIFKSKKESLARLKTNRQKKNPFSKPKLPIDENVFTIRPMTIEEQLKEVEERKHSEKYKLAPFKCTVCYMGFPTEDKLQRHSIKHSEIQRAFPCKICKARFKKGYLLRCHMARHAEEYICKQCPLVTRSRCVALTHSQFHAGKKYKCPRCSTQFEKRTTLLNHLRLKHISSNVCELCGYTFVSEMGVNSHKRLRHCTVTLNDIKLEGPYCNVCDVKFWNKKAYERHLRLSGKHIESEDDPNRLSNDANRRLNTKQDHVECEQKTTALKDHQWVHTGEKRYECDHCHKMFSVKANLANHMQVHEQVRHSYPCKICGKVFAIAFNRDRHMFIHTGLRPHKCISCKKCFITSTELKSHVDYVHLKKPRPKRVRRKPRNYDYTGMGY